VSPLDDVDNTPAAATAALPVSATVTEMSDTSPVSLSAAVADQSTRADDPATVSPHTAPSSISSPCELSADVNDNGTADVAIGAATTIPLVRSASTTDATLRLNPRQLTQSASTDDIEVKPSDTSATVDAVSEPSAAAASVSENGDSRVAVSDVATAPATTSSTMTAMALGASNETSTAEPASDEVCYSF